MDEEIDETIPPLEVKVIQETPKETLEGEESEFYTNLYLTKEEIEADD